MRQCALVAASALALMLLGCGKKSPNAVDSPFSMDFKCAACAHEFSHEWKQIETMKKEGKVVIPDGGLMQVTCPSCGEIKGQDADPRVGS